MINIKMENVDLKNIIHLLLYFRFLYQSKHMKFPVYIHNI